MKVERLTTSRRWEDRTSEIRAGLDRGDRLGLITSIDGNQILTVMLAPEAHTVRCFEMPVVGGRYRSITPMVPQAHWFERTVWDMFGLFPDGHLRLKRTHLHEPYAQMPAPLAGNAGSAIDGHQYKFLSVEGDSVFQIPVGPIHAGIIEPGHFRFSCSGEQIMNLEIRLGYVHRGLEKRLTEAPWRHGHFLAEAAASDMPVANALAHATAIESILDLAAPERALILRSLAGEVERIAMHIADLGGLGGDIGFLAISSSMARLRGMALRMGEILGGSRLMRGYVLPGGVAIDLTAEGGNELLKQVAQLRTALKPVVEFFFDNQVVIDRMEGVGRISHSLAAEFGLVGVAGRACGLDYDCRNSWRYGIFPKHKFHVVTEKNGDVLARAQVRVNELQVSLKFIEFLLEQIEPGAHLLELPKNLPANGTGIGIVESHRGELIHLIITEADGKIVRYCIKDASVNNWTGLAIAVRNNLVADFPLCNKSFALSYSGHDL